MTSNSSYQVPGTRYQIGEDAHPCDLFPLTDTLDYCYKKHQTEDKNNLLSYLRTQFTPQGNRVPALGCASWRSKVGMVVRDDKRRITRVAFSSFFVFSSISTSPSWRYQKTSPLWCLFRLSWRTTIISNFVFQLAKTVTWKMRSAKELCLARL